MALCHSRDVNSNPNQRQPYIYIQTNMFMIFPLVSHKVFVPCCEITL